MMNLQKTMAILLALTIVGCATTGGGHQPVTSSHQFSGGYKHALKALMAAGYEIKSQDPSTGLIQAMRPLKGAFAKPGYGHNFVVSVDKGIANITVNPIEGVLGGESPQLVHDEVVAMLGIANSANVNNNKITKQLAAENACVVDAEALNVRDLEGNKVKRLSKGDTIAECKLIAGSSLPSTYVQGALSKYQWGTGQLGGNQVFFAWKFIKEL